MQSGLFSLPLPKPETDETQETFMARCMISDAIGEFPDHDQQVAVCLSEYHRHQTSEGKAVKVLDEAQGLIGGFGIPFGGPVLDGRDLEGEFFDKSTDFHFDWFPEEGRPVLYEHGTDPELRLEPVGRQIYKSVDDALGVWVTAQLNMANRYAKAILELAKKGVLGFSSGALAGYVRRQKDGKITDWPWIEQTLTPRPANPYALIAPEAVKHFSLAGVEPPSALTQASRKKLTLPDGMSFEDLRGRLEQAVRKIPGIDTEWAWVTDIRDGTCIVSFEAGYVRYPFTIGSGGLITITGPGQEVVMETNWLDAPAKMGDFGRALISIKQSTLADTTLAAVATLLSGVDEATATIHSLLGLDENALIAIKAGRVMSAENLSRMHNAMKAMGAMHDALCDGKDCPMNPGDDGEKGNAAKAIKEFEAIIAGNGRK